MDEPLGAGGFEAVEAVSIEPEAAAFSGFDAEIIAGAGRAVGLPDALAPPVRGEAFGAFGAINLVADPPPDEAARRTVGNFGDGFGRFRSGEDEQGALGRRQEGGLRRGLGNRQHGRAARGGWRGRIGHGRAPGGSAVGLVAGPAGGPLDLVLTQANNKAVGQPSQIGLVDAAVINQLVLALAQALGGASGQLDHLDPETDIDLGPVEFLVEQTREMAGFAGRRGRAQGEEMGLAVDAEEVEVEPGNAATGRFQGFTQALGRVLHPLFQPVQQEEGIDIAGAGAKGGDGLQRIEDFARPAGRLVEPVDQGAAETPDQAGAGQVGDIANPFEPETAQCGGGLANAQGGDRQRVEGGVDIRDHDLSAWRIGGGMTGQTPGQAECRGNGAMGRMTLTAQGSQGFGEQRILAAEQMSAAGDLQQDTVLAGLARVGGSPGGPAATASRQCGEAPDIASRIGRTQLQARFQRLGIGDGLSGLKPAPGGFGVERIEAFPARRGVDQGEGRAGAVRRGLIR